MGRIIKDLRGIDNNAEMLWRKYRDINYNDERSRKYFFRIKNVPPSVAKKLTKGTPKLYLMDRQGNSPTSKRMIEITKRYNGTLEGYVIPVISGRDDARVSFDGFTIKTSETNAMRLKRELKPDEFDLYENGWRFWWD